MTPCLPHYSWKNKSSIGKLTVFACRVSEDNMHAEEASILRSLTGKRSQLDSVGNDVQIWELSPSSSPLPGHQARGAGDGGRADQERFSFFSDSPIDNLGKLPSPNPSPNIADQLVDLKEKTSMRLLGQLDAIVNRNSSRLFGVDGTSMDFQSGPAVKHKIRSEDVRADELPLKSPKKNFDETVENFLDAPTPVDEIIKRADKQAAQPDISVSGDKSGGPQDIEVKADQRNSGDEAANGTTGNVERKNAADSQFRRSGERSGDLVEDSEVGREGSPGTSPASPRRGNFRSRFRGASKSNTTQVTTAKATVSAVGHKDLKAEEVKSHSEQATKASTQPQNVQTTPSENSTGPASSVVHESHKSAPRNSTLDRASGNDQTHQAVQYTEPQPGPSGVINNGDAVINAGADPRSSDNRLVNVLRQRVRSIREADVGAASGDSDATPVPVGSPTPVAVVPSVQNPIPQLPSQGSRSETVVTRVHVHLTNDKTQRPGIPQQGTEAPGNTSAANAVDSSSAALGAASSKAAFGSSASATTEGFMPDGTLSAAAASVTPFSIHSQPSAASSAAEASNSQLAATAFASSSHSNLPQPDSQQTTGPSAALKFQESTAPQQEHSSALGSKPGDQVDSSQEYTADGNAGVGVVGIPLATVTSSIPVSVINGRVIGPGGLPITGPDGAPITVGLNGSGAAAPRGADLFLMQGVAAIELDRGLLGPEDLAFIDMHPTAAPADPVASGSAVEDTAPAGQVAAGGSPDTAAQVSENPLPVCSVEKSCAVLFTFLA